MWEEGVAGVFPAVPDVPRLPRVIQVAAAGRSNYREPAGLVGAELCTVVVEDGCPETGDCFSSGSGTAVVGGSGNKHVQHFRGTDAIDQSDACGVINRLPGFLGKVFPG